MTEIISPLAKLPISYSIRILIDKKEMDGRGNTAYAVAMDADGIIVGISDAISADALRILRYRRIALEDTSEILVKNRVPMTEQDLIWANKQNWSDANRIY